MGLKDDIVERATAPRRPTQYEIMFEALSEADRSDLEEVMADPSITSAAITAVLKERGYKINVESVRRQRRGSR